MFFRLVEVVLQDSKVLHALGCVHCQAEIDLNKKAISDINPGITQKDATVFEVSKNLWKTRDGNWLLMPMKMLRYRLNNTVEKRG